MKHFLSLLSVLLLTGCSTIGAYDGKTAEEWHQVYAETYNELDYYMGLYESESRERASIEDQLSEMQSCVYYAMPDIPYLGRSADYDELIDALTVALDGLMEIDECNDY